MQLFYGSANEECCKYIGQSKILFWVLLDRQKILRRCENEDIMDIVERISLQKVKLQNYGLSLTKLRATSQYLTPIKHTWIKFSWSQTLRIIIVDFTPISFQDGGNFSQVYLVYTMGYSF